MKVLNMIFGEVRERAYLIAGKYYISISNLITETTNLAFYSKTYSFYFISIPYSIAYK